MRTPAHGSLRDDAGPRQPGGRCWLTAAWRAPRPPHGRSCRPA